jgi:phosphatidylserine decarboxylase
MLLDILAAIAIYRYSDPLYLIAPVVIGIWLYVIFRDPRRRIPAVPLGVVSPVDGVVTEVVLQEKGLLGEEAHSITIAIDSFGTYTARCPVEGKIMDFRGNGHGQDVRSFSHGLWVQTDEGENVVLQFHGFRFGLVPLAFLQYGERIGQGQRCAYLRLAKFAEVQLPINGRVMVAVGDRVTAGTDVIGKLPHP